MASTGELGYETSPLVPSPSTLGRDNPAADTRSMRRIIADDPDWSLTTVPSLVELAIKHIVDNFASEYIQLDVTDVCLRS